MMGGLSRWNVLGDGVISQHMSERFKMAPEIVPGLLSEEAKKVLIDWSPGDLGNYRESWLFRRLSTLPYSD
jgi:hypothetical protein